MERCIPLWFNRRSLPPDDVTHADPQGAWRTDSPKLFRHWIEPERGPERATRSGKRIGPEQAEILIAAIEQIRRAGKNLPRGAWLEAHIDIDDHIAGNAPAGVAIILVAVRELAGSIDDASTHRPSRVDVEVGAQLQRIRGNSRNMIAPAHADRASFVGRRVVRACRDKWRSECRVDMAVAKAQIESAQMRGAGQFDALAARAPDVLKKTRVDRAAAAGDELDV